MYNAIIFKDLPNKEQLVNIERSLLEKREDFRVDNTIFTYNNFLGLNESSKQM